MVISVKLEPVPFARPRSHGKRFFNAPKYAAFKNHLSLLMRARHKGPPLKGPIDFGVSFYLKKPKTSKNQYPVVKPDLDNFLKAVMDAGNGILWQDDSQITFIATNKVYVDSSGDHGIVMRYEELINGG